MKNYRLTISLLFIYLLSVLNTNSENPRGIPSGTRKNNQPLFYIERSKNKNRVYYDANINFDGTINSKKPIDVYWINLEENYGKRGELSFIQEKFAYGYIAEKVTENNYKIKLKAFDKRIINLFIDNKGKAKAHIIINGQNAILNRLYIKANDKGLNTSVEYIEIFGTDTNNKKEIYEKIIP